MRYKNGIKDLVRIDLNHLKTCTLISDFSEVYEYKDNKEKQEKFGYKAEFVIADGEAKGLLF